MNYKSTNLYKLLEKTIPPVQQIEKELRTIEPALIGKILAAEPDLLFIFDYYFRLLPSEVGGRILSSPEFPIPDALELFNCQMVRYYRSSLESHTYTETYSSLTESYWKAVEKGRLTQLFREMLQGGKSNHAAALLVIQNMDSDDLIYLQESREFRSPAMLEFFKSLGGNIQELFKSNVNLYDFIYRLASDLNDEQYLTFLDEFTIFMVHLRIAYTMADEASRMLDQDGKISLQNLLHLMNDIPPASKKVALDLMVAREQIPLNLAQQLLSQNSEEL